MRGGEEKMEKKRNRKSYNDIPIGLYRKAVRSYKKALLEDQIELDLLEKQLNVVEAS